MKIQIAIPVVSPVKVLVTFTKFEELPKVDEFESAPSSPTSADLENQPEQPPSSWFQWIRTPSQSNSSSAAAESYSTSQDLFTIPSNYTWTDLHSKMKASDKNKPKDAKPSS